VNYSKYAGRAVSLLAFLPLLLSAQRVTDNVIPLKNWATPLYWQPDQGERKASGLAPRGDGPPASTVPTFLTFVAMTPCRLVDTRGASQGFIGVDPFQGPSIAAGLLNVATFPLQSPTEAETTGPAPCGAIPTIAAAYSLNLTVIPVAGGAANYVQIYPAGGTRPYGSTVNDVQGEVVANAAIVAAGTSGGFSVFNFGPATIDVVIDLNGYFASPTDSVNGNTAIGTLTMTSNTTGSGNVAIGGSALELNTTGGYNTATGTSALQSNSAGGNNTATGQGALQDNTTASFNTGYGSGALQFNNTGANNTASGYEALMNNTASNNSATGYQALLTNTVGTNNTASGFEALQLNTVGNENVATGAYALQSSTIGSANVASGGYALTSNTQGANNTASGDSAMYGNTIGVNNTADGQSALSNNVSGNNNIAIGGSAALQAPPGNSDSIYIGSAGTLGDPSGSIVIGTAATEPGGIIQIGSAQTGLTFIAGIYGAGPSLINLPVCVDPGGHLGTTGCTTTVAALRTPSSLRFKDQIADMGDSSDKLLQLRPVTFLYKPRYDDGSHTLQYGLIAEEVAKFYPEMVGYDKDGQASSINYQSLAPMLLNELQKQAEQIRQQAKQNEQEVEQIRELGDRLTALEPLLPATGPQPIR